MTNEVLLERLEAKLKKYQQEFDSVNNNPQLRNIAFGSAGYLSKASKNRLYAFREKIGKICDNIALIELSIKIVSREIFTSYDLYTIAIKFLSLTHPEFLSIFRDSCFSLYKAKEMFNIIFEQYLVPYRKEILKLGIEYENEHGTRMTIDL
jgi:hypothetical protein